MELKNEILNEFKSIFNFDFEEKDKVEKNIEEMFIKFVVLKDYDLSTFEPMIFDISQNNNFEEFF